MLRYFSVFLCIWVTALSGQAGDALPGQTSIKYSPGTALFIRHGDDLRLFPRFGGYCHALIQVKDETVSCHSDIQIQGSWGKIRSVRFLPQDIVHLAADENILYIDIAWRLNSPRTYNDTSRILSKVDDVHFNTGSALPKGYKGNGVIAGIVDIGFQPDNPTFYNSDGTVTRIRRWWQQNEKSGISPTGFSYGSEYSSVGDILSARDDDGTHGTHVGGIAAGSGYSTPGLKYRGMAPESDLVFVSIRYTNDSLGGSALGDYIVANPSILDGFDYIFKYASSQGKPAVANLSWGMHTGPHDGTSLFDKALENLAGNGRIICGSSGNDGGNQIHAGGMLSGDTLYTFAVDRSRQDGIREQVYVDAWGGPGKPFGVNVTLFDTLGNELISIPFYYSQNTPQYRKLYFLGADTLWFTATGNPAFVNNGKQEILFMVETSNQARQRIRVGFTGEGEFHAWNSGNPYRWTAGSFYHAVKGNDYRGTYINGSQLFSVGENGGTGNASITSGSYVARKEWVDMNGTYRSQNWLTPGEISGFSSRGPTADNRLKPDVLAPGQLVVSSVNYRTFAPWMAENTTLKTVFSGKDQYWTLSSGTSMASPHVAGIVALMLQAHPELGPEDVRSILRQTSVRDQFTGPDSNFHAGFGKINALEALKRVVQLSVSHSDMRLGFQLFPNPAAGNTHLIFPAKAGQELELYIYNAQGRLVAQDRLLPDDMGLAEINTTNLSPGCYLVSVKSGQAAAVSRLIIRP